jgi:hypothetical protein
MQRPSRVARNRRSSRYWRSRPRAGSNIIAPRRRNSAHLHRPRRARHYNDLTRLRPTLTRQSTLRPISEAHGRTVTGLGGFWTSPGPMVGSLSLGNRAHARGPTAPTRPQTGSAIGSPAGHPPAGSPGPAPIPGPSARRPEPGAGASPQPGGHGPYRARVPVADKRRRRATPDIRSQDLSGPQVMPYSPSPCVPQFHRPSVQAHPPGYSRQYSGVKVAPLVG